MEKEKTSIKILLVEDFGITRRLQIRALKESGFDHIIEAENGVIAMEKLKQEKDIGLIISDWNMPEMNGYDFLLAVRSEKDFQHIPFIMATAQGEKAQAQKAMESGSDHFIVKPFTSQELKAAIEKVLKTKQKPSEPLLSSKPSKKFPLTVAHIQITDHLALGVLDHLIRTEKLIPKYFELHTQCMPSWNPVQQSLEKGEVDAAFMLAPLAMDTFSAGARIRLILLSHKNGSICVKNKSEVQREFLHDYLKSKSFFLPHTMSVHHMLADMFLREIGLKLGPVGKPGADVFFEVVPPVKMPEFLAETPSACGFVVAEPFGTKAIHAGICDLMFLSGELWENHPCCVVAMRQEFIEAHSDAVYEFVEMLAQAGQFIDKEPATSAEIAIEFLDPNWELGLSVPLLESILTQPAGIKTDDLFPVIEDFDRIQRYMKETMGIGSIIDLEKFTDIRFAEAAYKSLPSSGRLSKINDPGIVVANMIKKRIISSNRSQSAAPKDVFEATRKESSVRFKISTDLRLVNRVIQETVNFLNHFGFGSVSEMNLILRELLNNAAEHGNRNDPIKLIECEVAHINDSLFKIVVKDEGEGFDFSKLNMSVPKDRHQIRKRGYPFINAFSEEIEFNPKGNRITVYHRMYRKTEFEVFRQADRILITPSGDITASEIEDLRALLKKLLEEGNSGFHFDFSKVHDIDSVGISAFIVLSRMASAMNKKTDLEIINASPDIAYLFRMTHLDGAYRICERG